MIQIPAFQSVSANFAQEINLNDQVVQLDITYNTRSDFFHLNKLTDPDGSILTGIKITPNHLVLDFHKALIDFDGDLIVLKTDEDAGDVITYDNLNNGYSLVYMTPDEVDQWKDDNGL